MTGIAVPTVTDAVFAPALAADPAGPLLTFYDDATGERTELSTLTTANWAAKTANFLRDETGLLPGDRVAVDLPVHWQTLAVLLGAWWAGADVVIGPSDAAVAFCSLDTLPAHADVDEVVVAPLDPFALPMRDLPVGVADYGSAVRVHGDQFAPIVGGPAALEGRTVAETVAAAHEFARSADIVAGSRILSTRHWDSADNLIANVLATFVVGGSLVQVAHPDAAALPDRATRERATATLS